ncbi:hypothetical protein HA402_006317 [Bradysia odoriphaga]|nr:hypothetical protein HA402_006317 [Bradysia odoriphaga]
MAVVASSYQRFESQKVVGRNYPWSTEEQCATRQKHFRQTKSILEEPKEVEPIYVEIPGSDLIINRFNSLNQQTLICDDGGESSATLRYRDQKSLHLGEFNLNEENNFTEYDQHKRIAFDEIDGETVQRRSSSKLLNIPVDNKVDQNRPRRPSLLDLNAIVEYENESNNDIDENNQANLDFSPDHPPPPPPHLKDFIFNQFNRMSTFKDMLVMNAELYIKEHVPRLPENLFEHDKKSPMQKSSCDTNVKAADEVDFIMPSRKKIIEGIEQEDIVAKSVAFTAWTFFLVMRMVSLSAFSVFYPLECVYLCVAHYLLMVACLFYETRFHEKIERIYFYLFLAYVYIFCILEFKIKFKRPRYWFALYTTLMLLQNLAITVAWYFFAEFESWWFGYMFAIIILSFCYSLLCFLVFYFILKPADKILYENTD